MPSNELYVVVLPLIHISPNVVVMGLTEQVVTFLPDRNFASSFFEDEVDDYLSTVKESAENHLTGGHVQRYEFIKERTADGRMIIRVLQHVE